MSVSASRWRLKSMPSIWHLTMECFQIMAMTTGAMTTRTVYSTSIGRHSPRPLGDVLEPRGREPVFDECIERGAQDVGRAFQRKSPPARRGRRPRGLGLGRPLGRVHALLAAHGC